MTVNQRVNAKTLGKRYAEIVRERNLPVQSIWATDAEGHPELWILTAQLPDLNDVKPVLRVLVDLQREFPDAMFDHRLLNPAWTPDYDISSDVPADAVRIELTE